MRKSLLTIFLISGTLVVVTYLIGSCRKNENPNDLQWVQQQIPEGFPQPVYQYIDNPLSKEGIELGRRLFYDGRLSIDGMHPCSSCHQQIGSFGTFEHDRSHGVFNSHTLRNAPVLINLSWQNNFHWDGQFRSLKDEAVQPINGHIEMGESWKGVIDKLLEDKTYRNEFRKVYRSQFIRPEFIVQALAQFTGTIVAADSKYDRVRQGSATFTTQEQNGYQVYMTNCAGCHPEPLFTDYSLRNIGLPIDPFLNDFGRMMVSGKSEDSLKFKVPTLRNVYISSNYMHDGRFNTLTQCINHYRTGVRPSPTLDPLLSSGISITNAQAADLAIFLRALTDSSILSNPKYSKPD